MARPPRKRPDVEDEPVASAQETPAEQPVTLVPQPEPLGGRTPEPQAAIQPQPSSAADATRDDRAARTERVNEPLPAEPETSAAAEPVDTETDGGSTLDVYRDSSPAVGHSEGKNPNGRNGDDAHYEAFQVGGNGAFSLGGSGVQLDLPSEKSDNRTAHLGKRVTPEWLKEHHRTIQALAALHGVSTAVVNTYMLNDWAESGPRVDARIKAAEREKLKAELEEETRRLEERRRAL